MILLIGPARWCEQMKHFLTDRTTHKNRVAIDEMHLRGTNEHIEIVMCTEGWEPNQRQIETMQLAQHLNTLAIDRRTKTL